MADKSVLVKPAASWWTPRNGAPQIRPNTAHAVHRDLLTGLSSRQALLERIGRLQARQVDGHVALVLVNIDDFKSINGALGHAIGDWFLRVVASRLRDVVPPTCPLARTGGDEFAVLLDGARAPEEAHAIARKIAAAVAGPVATISGRIVATVSIGISVCGHGSAATRLLEQAGVAMEQVKNAGGNACRRYEPSMCAGRSRAFALAQGIHRPELEGQLALHYQPVFDLSCGQVCSMEALMRWHLPEAGLVSPVEFIPMAERDGGILRMGRWALRHACVQVAAWRRAGLRTVPMAVNLSPRQLAQPDFVDDVLGALRDCDLPAQCLQLEITESALVNDVEGVGHKLAVLAAAGVRMAIDDFGTGYSSLSRLQGMPVHTLKIDRSFVSPLAEGERSVAVVAAIVALARALGLETVAEGVETAAQAEILRSLGCNRCQGYLYSRPVDRATARRMLQPA